jgi:hypothetical protein
MKVLLLFATAFVTVLSLEQHADEVETSSASRELAAADSPWNAYFELRADKQETAAGSTVRGQFKSIQSSSSSFSDLKNTLRFGAGGGSSTSTSTSTRTDSPFLGSRLNQGSSTSFKFGQGGRISAQFALNSMDRIDNFNEATADDEEKAKEKEKEKEKAKEKERQPCTPHSDKGKEREAKQ